MKLPFAAVVPVYNPEPGLSSLVAALVGRFETVVVVDDGSVEETGVFMTLGSDVVLLHHDVNCGKGRAMKTALAWLDENRPALKGVVFADGDGQHRLEDIVAVAERAISADRVVFGVRDFSAKGVPFKSWWGNRWTSVEVWLIFRFWIGDTQTGLRAIPQRLCRSFAGLSGERFEYEAAWFGHLRCLGEPIDQVPIVTIYQSGNRTSHFRPWTDTLLTQRALLRKANAAASYLGV